MWSQATMERDWLIELTWVGNNREHQIKSSLWMCNISSEDTLPERISMDTCHEVVMDWMD